MDPVSSTPIDIDQELVRQFQEARRKYIEENPHEFLIISVDGMSFEQAQEMEKFRDFLTKNRDKFSVVDGKIVINENDIPEEFKNVKAIINNYFQKHIEIKDNPQPKPESNFDKPFGMK